LFIEQAVNLTETIGLIGALTGRSLMVTKSMQKIREEILQKESFPEIILDLGFKTLEEANARFAAFIIHKATTNNNMKNHQIKFFSLAHFEWDNKRIAFEKALGASSSNDLLYAGIYYLRLLIT
jgi:hypothetical protein